MSRARCAHSAEASSLHLCARTPFRMLPALPAPQTRRLAPYAINLGADHQRRTEEQRVREKMADLQWRREKRSKEAVRKQVVGMALEDLRTMDNPLEAVREMEGQKRYLAYINTLRSDERYYNQRSQLQARWYEPTLEEIEEREAAFDQRKLQHGRMRDARIAQLQVGALCCIPPLHEPSSPPPWSKATLGRAGRSPVAPLAPHPFFLCLPRALAGGCGGALGRHGGGEQRAAARRSTARERRPLRARAKRAGTQLVVFCSGAGSQFQRLHGRAGAAEVGAARCQHGGASTYVRLLRKRDTSRCEDA